MKTNNTSIKKKSKKISPSYDVYETFVKKEEKRVKLTYLNMKTFERIEANDEFLLKLAMEWIDFTLDLEREALTLEEFYIHKSIYEGTMDDWLKINKELKQAHDYAKMIIAIRREVGALKRKYPDSFVARTQAMYSDRWKRMEEWRTEIKNKLEVAQKGNGVFNITVDDYTK